MSSYSVSESTHSGSCRALNHRQRENPMDKNTMLKVKMRLARQSSPETMDSNDTFRSNP